MKPRRLVLLVAATAALALPASAEAITVSGTAAPSDTSAGAHSDFNIHMDFTGGQVKDLTVGLPPGLVGDPSATPLCTVAQLNADACPANTVVGAVSADATVMAIPVTVSGDLYNLTAQPGEPARFGIVLRPPLALPPPLDVLQPIILQSGVRLRPDFGLDSVINDIPNETQGLPTTVNAQDITLFGIAPGTGRPFLRNPTSCSLATTRFTAVPYTGDTGTGEDSFTPTNCGALPFAPTFSAKVTVPGPFTGGQKPTLTTNIGQSVGEAGLRDAVVLVPGDFGADVNQITPGEVCPVPSFEAGACAAHTVVGSAVAASPLLAAPLTGPVLLVDSGSTIPKIGLDLTGQLHLRLTGQLGIDNSATFNGLPDIPTTSFQLTFNGGPDGLLQAKRDVCEPPAPVFNTSFVGYNGATTSGATAATVEGCVPVCKKAKGKKKGKKRGKKRAAAAKKKGKKKGKKKAVCKKKKKKKKGKKRR